MNQILAALRSIRLGAAVLVHGVMVRRSSLAGFDVDGKRGLDAIEAMQAIEAAVVDSSWPAPAAARVASKGPSVKSTKPKTLFAVMVEAVADIRGMATMNIRRSQGAVESVIVSCSAGKGVTAEQHQAAAKRVAQALRNNGHIVTAVGSDVLAFAA